MKRYLACVAVVGLFAVLIGCSGLQKGPPKTAEGAFKAVVDGLQQNKPVVLWDALPASYQQDLDDILHTAAGKVDPGLWDSAWGLFSRLITVAKDKRDMILNHPLVAQNKQAVKLDELIKNWDVVLDLLDTVGKCELGKIEKAKTMSVGDVLATTGAEFMAKAQKLSQVLPPEKMQNNPWVMLKTVKVTPVKQEGDTATLKIEAGGRPAQTFEFVRVEGKWIPMELAAFWKREIGKLRQQIVEMPKADPAKTAKAVSVIKGVNNALNLVIDAKTQDEFNMGMGQVVATLISGVVGGDQPADPGAGQPKDQ